ncbi:MAG: CHAT domain-containing protein [Spirochaetales bacterium]|nr:CHAT domain-containing protein [Spirochaetales bacterium]
MFVNREKSKKPVKTDLKESYDSPNQVSQLKNNIARFWEIDSERCYGFYDQLRNIQIYKYSESKRESYSLKQVEDFAEELAKTLVVDDPMNNDALSDMVIAFLKNKVDFFRWKNNTESIRYAEAIICLGQWRHDNNQVALGMMALGDSYALGMKELEKAWEIQNQGAALFLKEGNLIGWARSVIGRVAICIEMEAIDQTLDEARRALEIFRRYDENVYFVRLALNTMRLLGEKGHYRECLEYFHSARHIALGLGEQAEQDIGYLFINGAAAHLYLGEFFEALNYFTKARGILERLKKSEILRHIDLSLAMIEYMRGNYNRALELLYAILADTTSDNSLNRARFKTMVIECYLNLGRDQEALDLAAEVLDEICDLGEKNKQHQAHGLRLLGTAQAKLGMFDEAAQSLHKAVLSYALAQSESWLRQSELLLGEVLLKQQKFDEVLALAQSSAEFFRNENQSIGLAQAHQLMAEVYLGQGEFRKAQKSSRQVLKFGKEKKIIQFQYRAYQLLGKSYRGMGCFSKSQKAFQRAVELLITLQQNLTITLRPGFLADKSSAGDELMEMLLIQENVLRAFNQLELSKGMVIMGYLMNRPRLYWSDQDPDSRELLKRLNYLRSEYFGLDNYQQPGFVRDEVGGINQIEVRQKLKAHEKEIRHITEKLYLINAKNTHYQHVKACKLKQIQKNLAQDTLLLEFYIFQNRLWLFKVSRSSIKVFPLQESVEKINKYLENLYHNIDFAIHEDFNSPICQNLNRFFRSVGEKLYRALFEPVIPFFEKYEKVIIVPYGFLHYVPFNVLYNGEKFFIEHKKITLLPAASMLTRERRAKKAGMKILAHSNGGILPNVLREAELLSPLFACEIFMDKAALREKISGEPVQILHIAAHGWHRPDQPNLSCILLEDGYLYADDLLQQNLDYELVTLSACESGKTVVGGGEEILGLLRGVLYAGAHALVVSFWRVEDKLTSGFMEKFYLSLKEGKSKDAALREAQLFLMAGHRNLHPAYWGAFQLIGSPAPLSDAGSISQIRDARSRKKN